MNIRVFSPTSISLSVNEPMTLFDLERILVIFAKLKNKNDYTIDFKKYNNLDVKITAKRLNMKFLDQDVFNKITSESEMMRYIYSLQKMDISLVNSMISLGSCTMKLNAATEMVNYCF
jgi:glycine dehydrogenase